MGFSIFVFVSNFEVQLKKGRLSTLCLTVWPLQIVHFYSSKNHVVFGIARVFLPHFLCTKQLLRASRVFSGVILTPIEAIFLKFCFTDSL